MLIYAIVFCAGLLVGWNVFPQPECVEDFIENLRFRLRK
jgi:hypothetical protein